MASNYDISTYLLDKSYITDTITRMMLGFDRENYTSLIKEVYAPEVDLDYDPLLGGKPERLSSVEWTKRLAKIHEAYDTTQHVVHNLLVNLPAPGTARPEKCTAVAYAHGHFYKRNEEGIPMILAMRQGGRYELEFIRSEDSHQLNSWRISKLCVRLDWRDKPE